MEIISEKRQIIKSAMSAPLLFFIIIIEGFVTISAEILTIRQLTPVAGNSIVITSLIIGLFLLFLAYGYRRGGQYRDNYINILKNNFMKSALWLGLGLSYVFIFTFFSLSNQFVTKYVLLTLTAYLLLVTAPLVYILGQTVPITMNLIKAKTAGQIGGNILHLSTIGSFLGAILTSLWLMNYFGVAWTVFVNFCLLLVLTLVLCENYKEEMLRVIFLSGGLVLTYGLNIYMENRLFNTTNAYSNYQVIRDFDQSKIMLVNGSPSSMLKSNGEGYPYIEFIKKVLFQELKLSNKDILVLGAGGFSLSAENTFGNHFTYVDIDNEVKKIAETFFIKKTAAGEFVKEDARYFLSNASKKYDVIISDVYSNHRTIPSHLLTQEYFLEVKKTLQMEGIAIFNIIGLPTLRDEYSYRVDNTIRSVFDRCMAVPTHYSHELSNIIYICRKATNDNENAIYKDNLNRSTLDFFEMTRH